jgi:glutamate/tyrosine decarboxylase-like PLP-dependent enzyme
VNGDATSAGQGGQRGSLVPYPPDTLGMSADEMRRLGYAVVDRVVDRHCNRHREPAILNGTPAELRQQLGGPLPAEPGDIDAALALLVDVALAHQQHGDHPRYFARVPGPSSFAAVLGDWLATGFNTIAASWAGGSGPSAVELIVVDWLRELTGLPVGTEGVLVSGGSMANLTAIATARAARGPGAAYLTDQTHSSIVRALRTLGFAESEIRILPCDDAYRLDVAALRQAISEDRARGLKPMLVIATAGTTNTGSVDPLPDLADLCASECLWFHIDGAYGAPAAMTESGRRVLTGIERADSLVLDPHKWLFQPYDIGCTLVRHTGALEHAFTMNPEYLRDVQASSSAEVDFRNRSLELTRRSRAIKLWLTFRAYGAERVRAGIERGIELAQLAEQLIREMPDVYDLVTPAQLGIVTFAGRPATKARHDRAVQRVADTGFAAVTSTMLNSRSALRLCTINPLTTEDDLRETLQRLGAALQ